MLNKNSQTIKSGDGSINNQAGGDLNVFECVSFPVEILDEKIYEKVNFLRKARFHQEFDRTSHALDFGNLLTDGYLAAGSKSVRSTALAWCSRILQLSSEHAKADHFLDIARKTHTCSEVKVAGAFKYSREGNKSGALKELGKVDACSARTAALMIVAKHDGNNGAITWLKSAALTPSDLDSEGRFYLLSLFLQLHLWGDSFEIINEIKDEDFSETPVLYRLVAITQLLVGTPEAFRHLVLDRLPLYPAEFRFSDELDAIRSRIEAIGNFKKAKEFSLSIKCSETANIEECYSLWLELKDINLRIGAKDTIRHRLQKPKSALHLIPLALDFGIKLNLDAVQVEIDQYVALNGDITLEAALAHLSIALNRQKPKEIFDHIENYFEQLSRCLSIFSLRAIQIEVLAKSGAVDKARQYIEKLKTDDPNGDEIDRLIRLVDDCQEFSVLDSRRRAYLESKSLHDLQLLVQELDRSNEWDGLCVHSLELYGNTKNLKDAEVYIRALGEKYAYDDVVSFVNCNVEIKNQSVLIQMAYAWSLFYLGEMLLLKEELKKSSLDYDDVNYRNLSISMGIHTGDWKLLISVISHERDRMSERTPEELLQTASMAIHMGVSYAQDFIYASISKAGENAELYISAYTLWIKAGWDENAEVSRWLHKAADLSGDNGPIKKVSLRELVEMSPSWKDSRTEIIDSLCAGEISMSMAAESLNRSLVEMMLLPALMNIDEPDPRKRVLIPAYSGKNNRSSTNLLDKVICIDGTSIVALNHIKLLEATLDSVKEVYIPHSTLMWLFDEMQKITFHQPKLIKDAHKLRDLISNGHLERFNQKSSINSELADQVGDDLAAFISEAMDRTDRVSGQKLVVKPGPVHRIGSLMDEVVDLGSYTPVLSSCQAVVRAIRARGKITDSEEKNAISYLRLHELPWLDQPEVHDGATLFLDDLAVNYFMHIGLLGKLHQAGFKCFISSNEVQQSNALIKHEGYVSKVKDSIDEIRSVLCARIESGKIKIGASGSDNDKEGNPIYQRPATELIALSETCELAVIDDRFFNQFSGMGNLSKPMYTSLDMLSSLTAGGLISEEREFEARNALLRSGFSLFPLSKKEISHHLSNCRITDSRLVETAEVKAIRENIQKLQMSGYLQIPKELAWFNCTLLALMSVLKDQWKEQNQDLSRAAAVSNWILSIVDPRGWASSFREHNGLFFVREGYAGYLLMLMHIPSDMHENMKKAYHDWLESMIIAPIIEKHTDLFKWLVAQEKSVVIRMMNGLNIKDDE